MISADDQALVARDPSLVGLPLLLDEERMRERLAREMPGLAIGAVRAHYLRYKPATSCLVAYRVELEGTEVAVHALAWQGQDESRFRKAESRRPAPGPLGAGLWCWRDVPAMVWAFPNDLDLRSLRRLASDIGRGKLLAELARERPTLQTGAIHPLAYKPGRRFAGQLLGVGGEQAVLKLYSRSAYASRAATEDRITSGSVLRLPQLLGRSERHRAVLLEWLPGVMMGDLLRGSTVPTGALERTGMALAELHAQAATGLPERLAEADGDGLLALADTIALLVPERAEVTAELARRLQRRLAERTDCVPVHGDLHAKQIVVDDAWIGLLDLDRAARGARAEDLGNLLGHIERDEALGRIPVGRSDEIAAALLAGYRRGGGVQPSIEELALERAAALLRLAMQPFRDRERDWRARVGCMLDRVEAAARAAKVWA